MAMPTAAAQTLTTAGSARYAPGWSSASLGRRALPRVAISFPVRLHVTGLAGSLEARARDVGAGGMCVATPSPFAVSDLRAVTLLTPNGRVDLGAEARWQHEVSGEDGFFTGLRFLEVSDGPLELLWDLVHERAKSLARWLLHQPDFSGLGVQDNLEIAQVTRLREVRAGGLLYRQGSPEDSIFVVTRGEIVFELRTPRQRKRTLGRVGPGQVVGGLGLVANSLPGETAIADRDVSLLEISRGAFENLQAANPALAFHVASLVVNGQLRRMETALGRWIDEDR
jgi:hypothetical protein